MFEVGQKVVHVNNCGYGRRIGTVIAITEKRHDIKVDFGTYRATYRGDGVSRGSDPWLREYITPLTPEIAEKINHKNKVSKCGKLLNAVYKKVDSLTDEQLDKVISALGEVENEKIG